MTYKIKKAELKFDKEGKLERITTTAEMPDNPSDVRTIEARRSNPFWNKAFENYEIELQKILQKVTGLGSEL